MAKGHNKTTKKIPGWNVKEPKQYALTEAKERINLNPDAFDRLINQHGVKVRVFRSLYCPNVKSIDGGEHEIDCDTCNGSGFLDVRPIESLAFIQNQSLEKMSHVEGFVDGNSVAITFPVGIELQYFTLIELCDFTDIFFERIARSEGDIDVLKYTAQRVNVVIDRDGIEYFEGNDFCLDPNGNIRWKEDKGPLSETIYSIHYEAAVQFRATRALHVNRFEQVKDSASGGIKHVKFPEQWVCTKEFLVRRRDQAGEDILPNPIPEYDEGMTVDED